MAYLFRRKNSPFWWIGYVGKDGKPVQESTKCKIGTGPDERRARQKKFDRDLEEIANPRRGDGWGWVADFLKTKYQFNPGTLERYLTSWTTLAIFLEQKQIGWPGDFLRKHCFEFLAWRKTPDKAHGKYKCTHNSALLDLKIMRIIMQEAMERELCRGNPCVKLGIKKEATKPKPAFTPEIIQLIRAKILTITDKTLREFFHYSFEIARYQGCRLTETCLNPMTDVEISVTGIDGKPVKSGQIRFLAKGGKEFVTILHPELIPMFEDLQKRQRTYTWRTPEGRGRQWAGSKWYNFLHKIGLKTGLVRYTHHCARVTVATEMWRANVPENKAIRYMGHASSTMNRVYQRSAPKELDSCVQAVG